MTDVTSWGRLLFGFLVAATGASCKASGPPPDGSARPDAGTVTSASAAIPGAHASASAGAPSASGAALTSGVVTASSAAAEPPAPPLEAEWATMPPVLQKRRGALDCYVKRAGDWLQVGCKSRDPARTPGMEFVHGEFGNPFLADGEAAVPVFLSAGAEIEAVFDLGGDALRFRMRWPAGAPRPANAGEFVPATAPPTTP